MLSKALELLKDAIARAGFMGKPRNNKPAGKAKTIRTITTRASGFYKEQKAEFNRDNLNLTFTPGIKLARKASLGLVGLPHGRRGMMVRRDEDGRIRISN